MPAQFEDSQNVIGVIIRFEIEKEWRKAKDAQSSRGESGTFETMGGTLTENDTRRPRSRREVVGHVIEESLDADGRFQRSESAEFRRRKHREQS